MKRKIKNILLLIISLIPLNVFAKTYVVCHDHGVLKTLKFFSYLIFILKIIIPAALIITATYSLAKAMMDGSSDVITKYVKEIIIKTIVAIFIFFLPTLIYNLFDNISEYEKGKNFFSDCVRCLNSDKFCDDIMLKYPDETWQEISRKRSDKIKVDKTSKVYFPQIRHSAGANIVAEEETDSLKFSVEKIKEGKATYYVSRIWVKNPHLQLNKYDSPEYGKKRYTLATLFNYAISTHKLQDKAVLAFNASGFIVEDVWDTQCVNLYRPYNNTSVGTIVITNGEVVRNFYQYFCRNTVMSGVDKYHNFRMWHDVRQATPLDNKEVNQELVDAGIRNTLSFGPVLVSEGKKVGEGKNLAKRQALCQVNKNNFVLVTGSNLSFNMLQDILLANSCVNAVNLDGGGSTGLSYKGSSGGVTKIYGGSRPLPEIAYFTELDATTS